LGALPFGTKVPQDLSFSILDGYADAGGSFLDTANNYSLWHANGKGGESETVLGNWMTARSNRGEMFVATKAGFNTPETGISLSADTIRREVEGSLKRLKTDYVDLFYAHTDSRDDPLEETLGTMNDLIQEGKIRFIGCSNYRAWRIERATRVSEAHGWRSYCCVQQRFTYLRPKAGASFAPQLSANEDLLDFCTENSEVRMLAYSPLLHGAYSRDDRDIPEQYRSGESDRRLETLSRLAQSRGATVSQIIYAWMIQGTPGIIPLMAPTTISQLEENLGALEINLSNEDIKDLSE
jgi:aryl-alcohol dehydrogenase-like predicted oxidoreductase